MRTANQCGVVMGSDVEYQAGALEEFEYTPTNRERSQCFGVSGNLIYNYECSSNPVVDMGKDLKRQGKAKPKHSYKNQL